MWESKNLRESFVQMANKKQLLEFSLLNKVIIGESTKLFFTQIIALEIENSRDISHGPEITVVLRSCH